MKLTNRYFNRLEVTRNSKDVKTEKNENVWKLRANADQARDREKCFPLF